MTKQAQRWHSSIIWTQGEASLSQDAELGGFSISGRLQRSTLPAAHDARGSSWDTGNVYVSPGVPKWQGSSESLPVNGDSTHWDILTLSVSSLPALRFRETPCQLRGGGRQSGTRGKLKAPSVRKEMERTRAWTSDLHDVKSHAFCTSWNLRQVNLFEPQFFHQ